MLTPHTFRAIRALSGMTQAELSDAAGVSQTAIAEYELDKRDLRASTVRKLCDALGVQVRYTINGSEVSGP